MCIRRNCRATRFVCLETCEERPSLTIPSLTLPSLTLTHKYLMSAQIVKPEEEFHRVVLKHSDRNCDEHAPHFHLHCVHATHTL